MILFLDDNGFNREKVLTQLLQEQSTQPKCGYFQLRLYSEKHKIDFLRLYQNCITIDELKEDLEDLYIEYTRVTND